MVSGNGISIRDYAKQHGISYEAVRKQIKRFNAELSNHITTVGKKMYETYDGALYVVVNTASKPLTTMEMDDVYSLPYMRNYHPSYEKDGGIPAISEIKFSLTSNRGRILLFSKMSRSRASSGLLS